MLVWTETAIPLCTATFHSIAVWPFWIAFCRVKPDKRLSASIQLQYKQHPQNRVVSLLLQSKLVNDIHVSPCMHWNCKMLLKMTFWLLGLCGHRRWPVTGTGDLGNVTLLYKSQKYGNSTCKSMFCWTIHTHSSSALPHVLHPSWTCSKHWWASYFGYSLTQYSVSYLTHQLTIFTRTDFVESHTDLCQHRTRSCHFVKYISFVSSSGETNLEETKLRKHQIS